MASDRKITAAADLYSVTQLAEVLGVTARAIRFYETKKLIAPQRAGKNRVYTARDRARMILILRGKVLGFSLREIKEYLDLYDADPTHAKQVKLLVKAVRARISRLEAQRVALNETLAELRIVETQARTAVNSLDLRAREPALKPLSRAGGRVGSAVIGVAS